MPTLTPQTAALKLHKSGQKDMAVAVACGTTPSTIHRIRKGIITDPVWSIGDRLIRLATKTPK